MQSCLLDCVCGELYAVLNYGDRAQLKFAILSFFLLPLGRVNHACLI